MNYNPQLPVDFDPIAMGVEDLLESQEDSGDLDDEIESSESLEDLLEHVIDNIE